MIVVFVIFGLLLLWAAVDDGDRPTDEQWCK